MVPFPTTRDEALAGQSAGEAPFSGKVRRQKVCVVRKNTHVHRVDLMRSDDGTLDLVGPLVGPVFLRPYYTLVEIGK